MITARTLFFTLLSCAIISCNNRDKPIDILFNNIDKRLSESDQRILDSCETLSCLLYFIRTGHVENVKGLLDSLSIDVQAELDSNKIDKYEHLCLFVAYWKNRNRENYDLKKISNEVNAYLSGEMKYWDTSVNNRLKELLEMGEINYSKIQLRDTILLKCPTKTYQRATKIYYWDRSDDSNRVSFRALVLSKNRRDNEYLLKIKILSVENGMCRVGSQSLAIHDILTVDISNYGSGIKKD